MEESQYPVLGYGAIFDSRFHLFKGLRRHFGSAEGKVLRAGGAANRAAKHRQDQRPESLDHAGLGDYATWRLSLVEVAFSGLGPMNLLVARSVVLAGAVALGGTWACEPAQAGAATSCVSAPGLAGAFAFGCTGSSADYATLTLQVGGKTVSLSTNGFQGWVSNSSFGINIGGPTGANTNYMVGVYNGASYNDYFGFDLSTLGSNAKVTSATLTLDSGLIDQKLDLSLFGATQWISELESGSVDATLFHELATGPEYDPSVLPADTTNPTKPLVFTLNGLAVADINTAIRSPTKLFAVAGHADLADAVPEPSTWILMLAGFAALGFFAARRRAARRRGAASVS